MGQVDSGQTRRARQRTGRNKMSNANAIDLAYPLDPTTPVYPNYPSVAIEVLESTRYTHTDGAGH
jgi:hypothetical protein